MIRALAAAVLAATLAGCREAPPPRLWEAFDLLVLGEDAAGEVTLFRCPANDDVSEWGEPEAVLRHPALAGGTCLTASDAGEAFVVTPAGVAHVASDGTITPVWSDDAMRRPVHMSFAAESQAAFVTDSTAACVFVIDASADTWRTERVIESELFIEPIAARVYAHDGIAALEILDRGVDGLLRVELTGTTLVERDTLSLGEIDPVGFADDRLIVDANGGSSCLAFRRIRGPNWNWARQGIWSLHHLFSIGDVDDTPVAADSRHDITIITTSDSGTRLFVAQGHRSAAASAACPAVARPIDITLVD